MPGTFSAYPPSVQEQQAQIRGARAVSSNGTTTGPPGAEEPDTLQEVAAALQWVASQVPNLPRESQMAAVRSAA